MDTTHPSHYVNRHWIGFPFSRLVLSCRLLAYLLTLFSLVAASLVLVFVLVLVLWHF